MPDGTRSDAWAELVRTADGVRAAPCAWRRADLRVPAWARAAGIVGVLLAATAIAAAHLSQSTAQADAGADSTLFSLTNQDRSSNGVPALGFDGTLETIGEGGFYGGCGFAVHGRAVDMIDRNYFAHPIAGCGQYVFSIMQAYGVHYRSAGENIGWVSGEGSGDAAASYINSEFMNSPEHRDNILDAAYTDMGAGSDQSASGVNWTGAGSPGYQDVWMFAEEFAQLGSAAPPPPPPPPPRPARSPAPRNSPAPPAPAQPPAVATPAPTPLPTPTPTPLPTPTPIPAALLPASAPPPLIYQYQGLLPSSVESVLEAYLGD